MVKEGGMVRNRAIPLTIVYVFELADDKTGFRVGEVSNVFHVNSFINNPCTFRRIRLYSNGGNKNNENAV